MRPVQTMVSCFLCAALVSCGGGTGAGSTATGAVLVTVRLSFPDGASARTTGLPDYVASVNLASIAADPLQVSSQDVSLNTLQARMNLAVGTHDFYATVEGNDGKTYTGKQTSTIASGQRSLELSFGLAENTPPEIMSVEISEAEGESVMGASPMEGAGARSVFTDQSSTTRKGGILSIVARSNQPGALPLKV